MTFQTILFSLRTTSTRSGLANPKLSGRFPIASNLSARQLWGGQKHRPAMKKCSLSSANMFSSKTSSSMGIGGTRKSKLDLSSHVNNVDSHSSPLCHWAWQSSDISWGSLSASGSLYVFQRYKSQLRWWYTAMSVAEMEALAMVRYKRKHCTGEMESESRLTRVTVTYDPLGGESLLSHFPPKIWSQAIYKQQAKFIVGWKHFRYSTRSIRTSFTRSRTDSRASPAKFSCTSSSIQVLHALCETWL